MTGIFITHGDIEWKIIELGSPKLVLCPSGSRSCVRVHGNEVRAMEEHATRGYVDMAVRFSHGVWTIDCVRREDCLEVHLLGMGGHWVSTLYSDELEELTQKVSM